MKILAGVAKITMLMYGRFGLGPKQDEVLGISCIGKKKNVIKA